MSAPFTDPQGRLFHEMDAKAREVIERRFGVRLDSGQSSEKLQTAWDVYQNTTLKIIKAISSGSRIDDPAGYAATIARNSCRDYWRIHHPGWADLKGRLSRFFRKQSAWAMWQVDEQLGWICGPAGWTRIPMAEGSRVGELLDQPRRIRAGALPRLEMVEQVDSVAWDRLLNGFFEYLRGPVRLDELVSIAGVLFGVKGAQEMAFPETDDGRIWDPPAPEPRPDARIAVRELLVKLWNELKTMPKRWVLPFLLNPPVMKGSQGRKPRGGASDDGPDRGEVAVFTANGIATVAQIEAMIGFTDDQYSVLARELGFDAVADPRLRFATLWNALPLDDGLIARVMGLESGQKVINLRMVAKNHLARALAERRRSALMFGFPDRPYPVEGGNGWQVTQAANRF